MVIQNNSIQEQFAHLRAHLHTERHGDMQRRMRVSNAGLGVLMGPAGFFDMNQQELQPGGIVTIKKPAVAELFSHKQTKCRHCQSTKSTWTKEESAGHEVRRCNQCEVEWITPK